MKKKISFEKKIEFPTMIGEVCAISLEPNLKFINESNVEGTLLLSGRYKMTEASRLEEDFSYQIPVEIALTEKIDLNTSKVDITNFTYEVENDDTMVCQIELELEGLEVIEEEVEKIVEERECDGDIEVKKEIEIPVSNSTKEDVVSNEEVKKQEEEEVVSEEGESLFTNLVDDHDTYGTFLVYIVRQNESIHTIMEKYNTTLEELEKYNDLKDFQIGTKLIIPFVHD